MKKRHNIQYTIRRVPERVDQRLREKAVRENSSMNDVLLDALAVSSGTAEEPVVHHDLDALIGTWVEDEKFDRAIADLDKVDGDMWQ
jgi:hypothetical protein